MVNPNSKLLTGVSKLLEQLGSQHKDYSTVLTLQVRLAQVIHDEEQYGPTETTRSELFRVVEQLNRLCRENQQTTFNELSGIVPPYSPAATISTTEQPFLEGAVLYANMMGFSVLPRTVQNEIVGLMKQEIDKFLDLSGAIYWLDFRGGDFLLFLGCKPGEWQADTLSRAFLLGLELQSQVQVLNPQFRLGVTLHWEDGAQRYYLGSGSYLIGQALNEAQLLMSFSDSGHFFMSTVAYHHLDRQLRGREQTFDILFEAIMDRLNDRWPEHKQFFLPDKTCGYTCEIFTFHDRHKRQHTLYSLYGQDQNGHIIGDESTPCHRVAIEYRDTRKPHPDQVFVQRLVEANKATIIGLTHEGTAMFLREALRLREQQKRGFWDELQIVFPSASVLGRVVEKDRIPNFRLKKWEVGKSALFRFLLSRGPDCLERWDCLEFDDNLPFVGNWFVVGQDSGERKSSVRVAPVLPGGDMRDSYTMEVFEGVKAYTQLSNAFSVICSHSSRIVEWDVYGQLQGEELRYMGIVNRKRWDELGQEGVCFPVVLIMLYADTETGLKSILQKRTILNASDDFGTFSNISGRVTDMDICKAQGIHDWPPENILDISDDKTATAKFNKQTGLKRGSQLPDGTWEAAAIREIQEEIGLEITPDRLKPHCTYHFQHPKAHLLFRIFSLELKHDINELKTIRSSRPHAELDESFTMTRLKQNHRDGKLNRLLQNRFEEVFVPIFQELNIEE